MKFYFRFHQHFSATVPMKKREREKKNLLLLSNYEFSFHENFMKIFLYTEMPAYLLIYSKLTHKQNQ